MGEAVSCNIPCLAPKNIGLTNTLLLNGKGGELIKIGDYKNLGKKIINHFNSPKKLIKKTKIAKNNLFRFETKRHSKIYTNLFKKI